MKFKTPRLKTHKQRQTALTLAETLIGLAVAIILMILVTAIYRNGLQAFSGINTETIIHNDARKAIHQLSAELKTARAIDIPNASNNQVIEAELPVFQRTGSGCTSNVRNAISGDPIKCTTTACNVSCPNLTAGLSCRSQVCYKRVDYQRITTNGIPQLIARDPNNIEPDRILGNGIQTVLFQDDQDDTDLGDSEVRIQITAQQTSPYENRVRQSALETVVNARSS